MSHLETNLMLVS